MKIDIQCRGFSLTHAISAHVHKRVGFALGRGIRRLRRVQVTLSDVNGPRGGIDKRCKIEARLDGLAPVMIEDIQSDLYVAIDRAATRTARTVLRRLELDNHKRRAQDRGRLAKLQVPDEELPVH